MARYKQLFGLIGASVKTARRSMATNSWQSEKARLSELSLENRRKEYFCGEDNFVALEQIPTWQNYFHDNKKSLTEKVSEKDVNAFKAAHPDLSSENEGFSTKVSIFRGDITKLEIDSIVNAANEALLGGGGVDGAIHRGAGKLLLEECRTLNGCKTGNAKVSGAYKLPSKRIIHTVGPRGEKPELLQSCYETCLQLMLQNGLKSIAFPCISTGIYGYPPQNAAPIALKAVRKFLENHSNEIDRIIFCLFLENDVDIYERQLQLFFPVSE